MADVDERKRGKIRKAIRGVLVGDEQKEAPSVVVPRTTRRMRD
jgi:hypothetical protein